MLAGDSNASDNLYHEENDIDEESTPITTPSTDNGHEFGIIAPEIIQTSSFIYNRSISSEVIIIDFSKILVDYREISFSLAVIACIRSPRVITISLIT